MQMKLAIRLQILIVVQLVIILGLWLDSRHVIIIENQTTPKNELTTTPKVEEKAALASCPATSPHLVGPLLVEFNWNRTMEDVRKDMRLSLLEEGGRYKPPDCISPHKVAIIIPFRNRHGHLVQWLHYLHPILQRQQLDYRVYVINQDGQGTFNRARLMNVGFVRAMQEYNYTCVVFSDVDLIPMNDRNVYRCFDKPRHFSVAVDKFQFALPYPTVFGGVVSMSTEQYSLINGFSNEFWGWGGEDDDLYRRSLVKFRGISRPDMVTGRYRMMRHGRDLHNEENPRAIETLKRNRTALTMEEDGLSSLAYTVTRVEKDPLYTFITVDVGRPDVENKNKVF